jgi:hypothetical protein
MRYWEEDLPDWDAEDRDFAVAWRSQPKWVVSRSLKSAGPNATFRLRGTIARRSVRVGLPLHRWEYGRWDERGSTPGVSLCSSVSSTRYSLD